MAYTKQTWVDGPTGGTPISAVRLGHIEDGILAADNAAATATPAWVLDTLVHTLDTLAHPITLLVVYSSGWTINAALQDDANFGWHFVGGTTSTPPPATRGPSVWDHV